MNLVKFILLLFIIIGMFLISSCSYLESIKTPIPSKSFKDYQTQTLANIRKNRIFQLSDKESELQWNAPQQWRPEFIEANKKPDRGILLVHGLGDSPWSFHDIGQELAKQGYLVRTILLPGHGTTPYEMLNVTAEQWQRVVYEQAQSMSEDVDGDVFLGGFSTGANIVLDYAYNHAEIAGLLFFSPGFKSMPFDFLAPLVSKLFPWIIEPGDNIPMQTPLRYMNVPTNGYAQFYRTSVNARKLLEQAYNKPVFMAVAAHDSILDTDYLLDIFQKRFTHPQSRLIWYGDKPDDLTDQTRVLIRNDRITQERISQFSHMGLLFSPKNPLYGKQGSQRICLNGMDSEATKACENGADVWFSGWGYSEEDKVHARLTFNPYFQWQTSVMLTVLNK